MQNKNFVKTIILLICLIAFVIVGSTISNNLWGGKPEKIDADKKIIYSSEMTVKSFGNKNNLPKNVLKKVFNLSKPGDLEKSLSDFNYDVAKLSEKINKALALHSEEGSKNWKKILAKFLSWFGFLAFVFILMKKSKITPAVRKLLYLISIFIFGIVFGSDPSAMGTIKDAIVLYASKGVIFPPRMIALFVFLILVVLANKFFCSWGCQLGTLQDLIFRFNRNTKDNKSLLRQYKPPFVISNSIRVVFFAVFTLIAFLWTIDIVGFIDPFKIYKVSALSLAGWIFIGLLLFLSLFIYRPWCQFFCPFGLAGWLLERFSFYKIKVNYDTCIGCSTCAKACPTPVMDTILKQDKIIPDCFSCSTCINVCPTGSISFGKGKRDVPPENILQKLKS